MAANLSWNSSFRLVSLRFLEEYIESSADAEIGADGRRGNLLNLGDIIYTLLFFIAIVFLFSFIKKKISR